LGTTAAVALLPAAALTPYVLRTGSLLFRLKKLPPGRLKKIPPAEKIQKKKT
jgi:hypothetical protein